MIVLKPLTPEDADHFYALYKDPEVNHGNEPFLPGESPLDFTKRIIEACVEIYTIRLSTDEETIIGDCALHDPNDSDSEIEIGGSLLPAFQGKGLMQEAFRLLEASARDKHQMQYLVAKTEEENKSAIMLMKKLSYSKRSEENGIITYCKLLHTINK
jgi:ribosomal-protein-alanine N-acetyltransferase